MFPGRGGVGGGVHLKESPPSQITQRPPQQPSIGSRFSRALQPAVVSVGTEGRRGAGERMQGWPACPVTPKLPWHPVGEGQHPGQRSRAPGWPWPPAASPHHLSPVPACCAGNSPPELGSRPVLPPEPPEPPGTQPTGRWEGARFIQGPGDRSRAGGSSPRPGSWCFRPCPPTPGSAGALGLAAPTAGPLHVPCPLGRRRAPPLPVWRVSTAEAPLLPPRPS